MSLTNEQIDDINALARSEGWWLKIIAGGNGNYDFGIRLYGDTFRDESEAWSYLLDKAANGAAYARDALALVCETNKAEWNAIACFSRARRLSGSKMLANILRRTESRTR